MFHEFVQYLHTPQFRLDLYDKVVGVGFNVVVLSAFVPLILWLVRRRRSTRLRFSLRFYFFQVFHGLVDVHLRLASINYPMDRLLQALREKKLNSIGGTVVYGNIENKFWLLREVISSGELEREIAKRTPEEIARCVALSKTCLDEIDRLAGWVAASPKLFEMMMMVRFLAFGLHDHLERITTTDREGARVHFERAVVGMAPTTLRTLERLFRQERKHIDNVAHARYRGAVVRLIVSYIGARLLSAATRIAATVRDSAVSSRHGAPGADSDQRISNAGSP